jgi:hypothetical protein
MNITNAAMIIGMNQIFFQFDREGGVLLPARGKRQWGQKRAFGTISLPQLEQMEASDVSGWPVTGQNRMVSECCW